ncbi:rifin [Plasmodium falciparum IGH-CR14]|uniref:Rifin n=1 Tax=Plasmodium falciparum IGH-CR14 TaxID=580059 RepID=A0A0L1I3K6_PLAFA|nr:rifin [Plasmodium falciparum IGH-CR14]
MKDHYINILLFALPLNILVYNRRNYYITPRHTETNRSLCECELYSPTNYDSDPEMKRVMQQFVDRTTQRFHEYDERMKTTRQKCREQCDKEIQKIILKDKLEKQMAQQFSTLHTDIQSDDIPTCICEKSLADKVEKGCLRCGGVLGGGIAPTFGLIGSVAINMWKTTEIAAVIAAAEKFGAAKGAAAGLKAGVDAVITGLKELGVKDFCPVLFKSIGISTRYNDSETIISAIMAKQTKACSAGAASQANTAMCTKFQIEFGLMDAATRRPSSPPASQHIPKMINELVSMATDTANARAAEVSSATYKDIMTKQTAFIEAEFNSSITSIYAPIIAIVVIVLIMIIIYLILRYRRKKKMKKKLQYIKLLEE